MQRILIIFFCLATLPSFAQKKWTLEECIDYAYKNNLTIKQSELDIKTNEINLREAKMATLPNLNANASHGYNFGRSIDPFTNQFVAQKISNSQFGLSSSLILFNGFQIINNIKFQREMLQVSRFDLEVSKNDIGLSIANAYLQVLFAQELVAAARKQKGTSEEQLKRTQSFRDAGRVADNAVLEMQAQLANDNLSVVNAQNQLQMAHLTLWQLLELKPEGNDVTLPNIDTISDIGLTSPDQLYDMYTAHAPELKSAERRLTGSELNTKIAKGAYYPRLVLGANINTIYSENFKQGVDYQLIGYQQFYLSPDPTSGYYVPINQPSAFRVTPFGQQLGDNLGQTLGLSLNIPIFNNYRSIATVKRAKINYEMSRLNLQLTKNNIYRQVSQAYTEYLAAKSSYEANKANIDAVERSFEYAKARKEAGILSTSDYIIQQNNFNQAQANFLRSKYEYLFRIRIIDFYKSGSVNPTK